MDRSTWSTRFPANKNSYWFDEEFLEKLDADNWESEKKKITEILQRGAHLAVWKWCDKLKSNKSFMIWLAAKAPELFNTVMNFRNRRGKINDEFLLHLINAAIVEENENTIVVDKMLRNTTWLGGLPVERKKKLLELLEKNNQNDTKNAELKKKIQ